MTIAAFASCEHKSRSLLRCPILIAAACAAMLLFATQSAIAQRDNPVYVDDSPQAWEMFRQALDQTQNNPSQAVALYQELLDEFAYKLIPVNQATNEQFAAVRLRTLRALSGDAQLLERYRLIQTPQAQRMLQSQDLVTLARTRSLTEPGLEAMLVLAQQDLEFGRFFAALQKLEEVQSHPDFHGRRAVHGWYMTALAAHYSQQTHTFEHAEQALTQLGGESSAFRLKLTQIRAHNESLPQVDQGISGLDVGRAGDLRDIVAQTIWSAPLDDSPRRSLPGQNPIDVFEGQPVAQEFVPGRTDARTSQPTVMATAAGMNVYVSQAGRITAFNRLTGHMQWTHSAAGRLGIGETEAAGDLPDMGIVAVHGNSVVALVSPWGLGGGNAAFMGQGGIGRSSSGRIVCLDATSGSVRWTVNLANLTDAGGAVGGGGGEALIPHGAPIIAEGKVFITARRFAMQAISSAYVIALDLNNNGQVLWVRYITSSGRLRTSRPFCTLTYNQGSLYIASALGAMARLDAATGQTRWLHRFSVPMMYGEESRRPWDLIAPLVTARGIIALQPDQRRLVLLDSQTGDLVESYSVSAVAGVGDWNLPRYLLFDGQRVYSVGTEIRAFDLNGLEQPIWRTQPASRPGPQPLGGRGQEPASSSMDIRGRVHLAGDVLLVPLIDGIVILDCASGQMRNRLDISPSGNPLAMDSQILVASSTRLDSFMSFHRAQEMLRERIAQTPAEPEPALSLLKLALRGGEFDLTLEAADLANRAISRAAAGAANGTNDSKVASSREELFNLLLEVAGSSLASTRAQGESLHSAIAAVASTSAQRVEHLLAYGQWLSQHDLPRCVETYQSILTNSALAQTEREEGGVRKPASDWTTQRLADLVGQRGRGVYAPQSDFASRRLRQVLDSQPTNASPADRAQRLLTLAMEFPLSDAAMDATTAAADVLANSGNRRAAMAALARMHLAAPRQQTATRLMGHYVRLCEEAGWIEDARRTLHTIVRDFGDLQINTSPGQRSAAHWLENLQQQTQTSQRLAQIGDHADDAQPITGSLVTATRRDPVSVPPDRALIRDGTNLQLIGSKELKPLWAAPASVLDIDPALLRFNLRDIVLWQSTGAIDAAGDQPRKPALAQAVMIDSSTGSVRWTTPDLPTLLVELDPALQRLTREPMPDDHSAFDVNHLHVMINSSTLIVLHRSGAALAFSLEDGTTLRWQRKLPVGEVHAATLTDGMLLVGGMAGGVEGPTGGGSQQRRVAGTATQGDQQPMALIIDPMTGRSVRSRSPGQGSPAAETTRTSDESLPVSGRSPVRWVHAAWPNLAVIATGQGVEAFDVTTGQRRWSNNSYAAASSLYAWNVQELLVVESERARLRTLDPVRGSMSALYEIPAKADWDAMELRDVKAMPTGDASGPMVAARYRQRAVVFDLNSGSIVGSDSITDERDYRELVLADERMLVFNSQPMQAPAANQIGRHTRYFYRVYQLSNNGKAMAAPLALPALNQRLFAVGAIDGWLLVSTPSVTLAIPTPPTKVQVNEHGR